MFKKLSQDLRPRREASRGGGRGKANGGSRGKPCPSQSYKRNIAPQRKALGGFEEKGPEHTVASNRSTCRELVSHKGKGISRGKTWGEFEKKIRNWVVHYPDHGEFTKSKKNVPQHKGKKNRKKKPHPSPKTGRTESFPKRGLRKR